MIKSHKKCLRAVGRLSSSELGRMFTADEISEEAQEHRSTMLRAAKSLCKAKLLRESKPFFVGDPLRFEITDLGHRLLAEREG